MFDDLDELFPNYFRRMKHPKPIHKNVYLIPVYR